MRNLAVALVAAVAASASAAQAPSQPSQPPPLLVRISVDTLSSDLFARYRPHFTGGLAWLSQGVVFPNATPAARPVGPTIGDLLESGNPQSLTVTVAGDRRSAMALAGASSDQRWHWDGSRFASDLAGPAPRTVALANAAVASMIATAQAPLVPPPACPAASGAPNAGGRFARPAGDAQAFASSPALDGALLALSAGMIQELRLGTDAAPDLLSIGLPATGRVAQRFGPGSEAACLQILSLDRDLGDFFRLLDRMGRDYAVVLSAEPSVASSAVPIVFWRRGMAAATRNETVSTADIVPTLAAMLSLAPPPASGGKCLEVVSAARCPAR